jgi:hypothetical protein
MKTTDLFKINRTSKRLNESMFKTFGRKLNLETFNVEQLEDARNKLRTQIYTARSSSGFNETVENDALSQAQFMHDAIVAELSERDEPIVDNTVQEGADIDKQALMMILKNFDENMNERGGYGDPDYNKVLAALNQGDVDSAVEEVYYAYSDQDGGEIDMGDYIADLEDQFKDMVGGVAEADELRARGGLAAINKKPRPGQTDLRNIPAGNLPGSRNKFTDKDREEHPANLKAKIKATLGKHTRPNLPKQGVAEEIEQKEYTFADYLEAARAQYVDEDAVLVANEAFKNQDITLFIDQSQSPEA